MKRIGANDFGAIIIALIAATYLFINRKYPLWGDYTFSSGFYPMLLGILLLILTVFWFISNRKLEKKISLKQLFPDRSTMIMILILILCTSLFNVIGALLYLILLTGAIWFLYEKFSLRFSIIASVVLSVSMYVIFRYGLNVYLPKGFLPF